MKFLAGCSVRSGRAPHLSGEQLLVDRSHYIAYQDHPAKADLPDRIFIKLLTANRNDNIFKANLQSITHTSGWYDGLAAAVLVALEKAIRLGEKMGPAIKSAYETATAGVNKVKKWAEEHPQMAVGLFTLVALGILAIMMPWLMAWLGVAEDGEFSKVSRLPHHTSKWSTDN